MYLKIIYFVIYFCIIVVSIWAICHIKRFLEQTPSIEDEMSLEKYKSIARRNMYIAIFYLPIAIAGLIVGLLLAIGDYRVGLSYVLPSNAVVILLGKYMGNLEKKARSLPCASPELEVQHKLISETWVKKAFPDF